MSSRSIVLGIDNADEVVVVDDYAGLPCHAIEHDIWYAGDTGWYGSRYLYDFEQECWCWIPACDWCDRSPQPLDVVTLAPRDLEVGDCLLVLRDLDPFVVTVTAILDLDYAEQIAAYLTTSVGE